MADKQIHELDAAADVEESDVLPLVRGIGPAKKASVNQLRKPPAPVAVPAMEIDWAVGQVFTKVLAAGANEFTFANAAGGMVIIVRVTSAGTGSTLTWPGGVRWTGGGIPPTQTPTGTDIYTFFHDGTDIFGTVAQNAP